MVLANALVTAFVADAADGGVGGVHGCGCGSGTACLRAVALLAAGRPSVNQHARITTPVLDDSCDLSISRGRHYVA